MTEKVNSENNDFVTIFEAIGDREGGKSQVCDWSKCQKVFAAGRRNVPREIMLMKSKPLKVCRGDDGKISGMCENFSKRDLLTQIRHFWGNFLFKHF